MRARECVEAVPRVACVLCVRVYVVGGLLVQSCARKRNFLCICSVFAARQSYYKPGPRHRVEVPDTFRSLSSRMLNQSVPACLRRESTINYDCPIRTNIHTGECTVPRERTVRRMRYRK